MQIQLNGEPYDAVEGQTLTELIDQLGLAGKRVAVEVNMEIVPRSEHAQTQLSSGDRIEVVAAIGGG